MYKNELKIMVPGCRVAEAKVMPDGSCLLMLELAAATAEDTVCHVKEDIFKLVPASQLSLSDKFLNYTPKTRKEEEFMEEVKAVIQAGVSDFWRPIIDPSLDDNGRICYQYGMKPVVGKSYNWWSKEAKSFCPERKSRLGTKFEYIAFVALLIKELYASGWDLERVWNEVCNDSKELGHYWNSRNAKNDLETTGNRGICGWYDLANTFKILEKDEKFGNFWLASGGYGDNSDSSPLADLYRDSCLGDVIGGAGWLVLTD